MTWLQCKHCKQLSMMLLGTEEWCYKCGYSNDLTHPLRQPTEDDVRSSFAHFQSLPSTKAFSSTPEYFKQRRQALKEATD